MSAIFDNVEVEELDYLAGWVVRWLLDLKHVMTGVDAHLNGAALKMITAMLASIGKFLPSSAKLAPTARLVTAHVSVRIFHRQLELYIRQHLMTPQMLLVHGADLPRVTLEV